MMNKALAALLGLAAAHCAGRTTVTLQGEAGGTTPPVAPPPPVTTVAPPGATTAPDAGAQDGGKPKPPLFGSMLDSGSEAPPPPPPPPWTLVDGGTSCDLGKRPFCDGERRTCCNGAQCRGGCVITDGTSKPICMCAGIDGGCPIDWHCEGVGACYPNDPANCYTGPGGPY